MTAPSALRVLAVDGTPLVREGLRTVIQQVAGLRWLGATGSPQALRDGLPRLRPHVVLLDSTVDPAGEFIGDLVDTDPALTVVAMLNDQHRTTTHLRTARIAGAHGLVRRDTAPTVLVTAILQAHSSRWFVDPGLVPPTGARHPSAPPPTLLTTRQRQVLDLIAGGMTELDIAQKLVVSPETVRTHIKQMRRRLGARDRAHAVARGYHLGVLAAPDVERSSTTDS